MAYMTADLKNTVYEEENLCLSFSHAVKHKEAGNTTDNLKRCVTNEFLLISHPMTLSARDVTWTEQPHLRIWAEKMPIHLKHRL